MPKPTFNRNNKIISVNNTTNTTSTSSASSTEQSSSRRQSSSFRQHHHHHHHHYPSRHYRNLNESAPLVLSRPTSYGSLLPFYEFVRTSNRRHSYYQTLHKSESMLSVCFQTILPYINNDDLTGLQSLLEKQIVIDDRDENGTTALMVAASKGRSAFVRELLAHGADPNAEDNDNWTPLLCAAKEGHCDVILQLLDNNAEIDHHDMGGWTALMWATYKGHTNIVLHLLQRGADVNAHGNFHISSLLWAAGRGETDIARALIQNGAKVNVGDKYGTTALVWASRKGYSEIVEMLLNAGSNVDTAGMYSWTALLVATYGNHVDVVNLLLEHKPNVNALDKDGCSPLTIACKEGFYEIATALLAAGAYINIQDRAGDTNLIHAIKGGHKNIVETLLKKYADVDIVGKDRKSPLYVAVEKGNTGIVKLLFNQNPDLESATKDGDTPLLKAVRNRNSELVQLLLDKKAKVSATDKKGDTALHVAMRARSKAIVEILLRNPKHSQLLYRPNRAGETPYNIDMNHPKTILGQIFGARRLNTNEDNENMLGYDLYSSALADILSQPSLSMPITVGLYAKWGSGKSFLLNKLRDEMINFAKQCPHPTFKFTSLLFVVILHISIIITTIIYIIIKTTSENEQPEIWSVAIGSIFVTLSFLFLIFIWFGSKKSDWDWVYDLNIKLSKRMTNIKLVLQILFCHPPGAVEQEGISQPIRFYFTDHARVSSTTGGENSIVQMIGSLYDSIENQYGTISTRLYRALKLKTVKSSSTWTWRKTCCLPYFVIFEIIFCMIIVAFSVLAYYLAQLKQFGQSKETDVTKSSLEIVLMATALILSIAIIANAYSCCKLFKSVIFSQRRHLQRSISNVETLKSEGFLQTLRQEVNLMKDMVKCLDRLSFQQSRLVIVVDGLDSCEQEKVLLILDTVHMLFSDANSPFIVILAIDPHVIAKAVEMNTRRLFSDTNISGHNYLSNMIHLPFYLQNSGLRKVKVAQQVASVHKKISTATTTVGWTENEENLNTFLGRSSSCRRLSSENAFTSASKENLKYVGTRKGSRKLKLSESIASSIGSNLNRIGGAQDLTKMLLTDDYFSDVNPRTMRRLMNVVYVTGRLLKAFQIDFNWYRLASWINITEQWPFRTSWIIYHYDLYEDQLDDATPLRSIYDKIRPLIPSMKNSEPLLELDRDEKKFDIFLTFHRSSLLVSDLKIFLPFTINLDPYLKKVIKEEIQAFEDESLYMQQHHQAISYPTYPQPQLALWPTPMATDWSNVTVRPNVTPATTRERRQGVVNMPKILPPYPQSVDRLLPPGPPPPQPTHWNQYGIGGCISQPTPNVTSVPVLKSELLESTKLSNLSVDGVCKFLSEIDDLTPMAVMDYTQLIKENNISGKVLLHCDLDDLKKLLHMSFGDWELFKVILIQLREREIASMLMPAAGPFYPGPSTSHQKVERKGSLKSNINSADQTDSIKQMEVPRERKQSIMEKQVTLEEQTICGALQTLNEEACEDVMEETEDETKIRIEPNLPQTSVIPPSPDYLQDVIHCPNSSHSHRSRANSVADTDYVLLQSSPVGHMHWQPVSIRIGGNSESISDHSSRCSSELPSPVQERKTSLKRPNYDNREDNNKPPKGKHVMIKTGYDNPQVSISTSNISVKFENESMKLLPSNSSAPATIQPKIRPTCLYLKHENEIAAGKSHNKSGIRIRSKSIDNSHNSLAKRERKGSGLDKFHRLRDKLLLSSPELNETSDNESTPLVSEVSSPSNKSGQSSDPRTGSGSINIPISPLSEKSLSPDDHQQRQKQQTRSEQNLVSQTSSMYFNEDASSSHSGGGTGGGGGSADGGSGRIYGAEESRYRFSPLGHPLAYSETSLKNPQSRSRAMSEDSTSSVAAFLNKNKHTGMKDEGDSNGSSVQSFPPSSPPWHLSRQNAIDSEYSLTDEYCNPFRDN